MRTTRHRLRSQRPESAPCQYGDVQRVRARSGSRHASHFSHRYIPPSVRQGPDCPQPQCGSEPEDSPPPLARKPARICAVGNAPRKPPRAAILLPLAGDQLVKAPEDRLGQTATGIVFIESQQRLPVQRGGVTLVNDSAPSRPGRSRNTSRIGLTQPQHRKLRASQRRCSQQTSSATEVQSDYPTLPRRDHDHGCLPSQVRGLPSRRGELAALKGS
jgi:hypothetical protein